MKLYIFEDVDAREELVVKGRGWDFWKTKAKFECSLPNRFEARPIIDPSTKQQHFFLDTVFSVFELNNNRIDKIDFRLNFTKELITVRNVSPESESETVSTVEEIREENRKTDRRFSGEGSGGTGIANLGKLNLGAGLNYDKKKSCARKEVSNYSKKVYTIQSGGHEGEQARWIFKILKERQEGTKTAYKVAVDFTLNKEIQDLKDAFAQEYPKLSNVVQSIIQINGKPASKNENHDDVKLDRKDLEFLMNEFIER